MHEAAKEMVQLAEQGYTCREEPSDPAWQEMLNHATMKVSQDSTNSSFFYSLTQILEDVKPLKDCFVGIFKFFFFTIKLSCKLAALYKSFWDRQIESCKSSAS
jgi:hypothetical protein